MRLRNRDDDGAGDDGGTPLEGQERHFRGPAPPPEAATLWRGRPARHPPPGAPRHAPRPLVVSRPVLSPPAERVAAAPPGPLPPEEPPSPRSPRARLRLPPPASPAGFVAATPRPLPVATPAPRPHPQSPRPHPRLCPPDPPFGCAAAAPGPLPVATPPPRPHPQSPRPHPHLYPPDPPFGCAAAAPGPLPVAEPPPRSPRSRWPLIPCRPADGRRSHRAPTNARHRPHQPERPAPRQPLEPPRDFAAWARRPHHRTPARSAPSRHPSRMWIAGCGPCPRAQAPMGATPPRGRLRQLAVLPPTVARRLLPSSNLLVSPTPAGTECAPVLRVLAPFHPGPRHTGAAGGSAQTYTMAPAQVYRARGKRRTRLRLRSAARPGRRCAHQNRMSWTAPPEAQPAEPYSARSPGCTPDRESRN